MGGSGRQWEALRSIGRRWEAMGGNGRWWETEGCTGRQWEAAKLALLPACCVPAVCSDCVQTGCLQCLRLLAEQLISLVRRILCRRCTQEPPSQPQGMVNMGCRAGSRAAQRPRGSTASQGAASQGAALLHVGTNQHGRAARSDGGAEPKGTKGSGGSAAPARRCRRGASGSSGASSRTAPRAGKTQECPLLDMDSPLETRKPPIPSALRERR